MTLSYQLWDVFTDTALAGNPLAVIPDASGLSDAQMQAVAKEFNLSETSFVFPSDKADVRPRYFTPARELPMAGHPSVGTTFSLHRAGRVTGEQLTLELGVGVVPMTLEAAGNSLKRAWMGQGVPKHVKDIEDRAGVARALGLRAEDLVDALPVQIVSAGVEFMLVALDSLELLGKAYLNLAELPPGLDPNHRAVYAFTLDAPDSDLRGRMFGEALGVVEDPATGGAHGPLGWYVATHKLVAKQTDAVQFVSHQGVEMGRPSEIDVRVRATPSGFSVDVGGHAVLVGEGKLYL